MATAYSLPESFEDKVPDLMECMERERGMTTGKRGDLYFDECNEFKAELAEFCRKNGSSDLLGEVIRIGPVGDGYAEYMVWTTKPLALLHLPLGDAWQAQAPHIRGLRVSDIREQIRAEKSIADLFGSTE